MSAPEWLEGFLDAIAERTADKVVLRLRSGSGSEWIRQGDGALPVRVHIGAVRGRLERGEGGAAISGRAYLLTRAAHDEELNRLTQRQRKPREQRSESPAEELKRELRLVRSGR